MKIQEQDSVISEYKKQMEEQTKTIISLSTQLQAHDNAYLEIQSKLQQIYSTLQKTEKQNAVRLSQMPKWVVEL